MSKKQAKSDRNVDLPDWADDVTPAEEVMKKFYAPTGSFKPGPIAIPKQIEISSPATSTDGINKDEATHHAEIERPGVTRDPAAAKPSGERITPEKAAAAESPASVVEALESRTAQQGTSLPSPALDLNQVPSEKATPKPELIASSPIYGSSQQAIDQAQTSSFEEFGRKWRRYLYPGQLAVMRTLCELTIAQGTFECFTRYNELASATKMSRRNCINVMNSLVERGFVQRLEVRNDATGKGIRLRIHLDPLQ